MKYKEIVEQKEDALNLLESNLRKELAELWMQSRSGQLTKTAQMGKVRRDIARVLTARKQKAKA